MLEKKHNGKIENVKSRKKKVVIYSLIIILAIVISITCLASMLGWDRIYCISWDIDVYTGDIRSRRYIVFVLLKEQVYTTQFSELARRILGEQIGLQSQRLWKHDYTKSLFIQYYEYGGFHGSISQCEAFVRLQEVYSIPESELGILLKEFLELLRKGESKEIKKIIDKVSMRYSEKVSSITNLRCRKKLI